MDSVVQQDRANMTEAEWQTRCDLAALYRISDMYGWTDTIDTHMTVRIYIASQPDRATALEDVVWSILNLREFIFRQ